MKRCDKRIRAKTLLKEEKIERKAILNGQIKVLVEDDRFKFGDKFTITGVKINGKLVTFTNVKPD